MAGVSKLCNTCSTCAPLSRDASIRCVAATHHVSRSQSMSAPSVPRGPHISESASALRCRSVAPGYRTRGRRLREGRPCTVISRTHRARCGLLAALTAARRCRHRSPRAPPQCAWKRTCRLHPPRRERYMLPSAGFALSLPFAFGRVFLSPSSDCLRVMRSPIGCLPSI